MSQNRSPSPLFSAFADPVLTAVHRAIAEVQGQRPLAVHGPDGWRGVLAIDGLDDARLDAFVDIYPQESVRLVLSAARARMLGLDVAKSGPVATDITTGTVDAGSADRMSAARMFDLATSLKPDALPAFVPASTSAAAAVEIVKLAQRLPAILISAPQGDASMPAAAFVGVEAGDVESYRGRLAETLEAVSEARVPVAGGITSRFVVFRDAVGGIASAIVVGRPQAGCTIPVRVHSSCATGDIFGSRRCDCGEQLQLALARLDALGGGILIYLDQEGRGLGLANKMHAYTLQDDGLDTVDANLVLGFHDDERDYHAAGVMLRKLGWTRITLLTNNPTKLNGLTAAGIEIAARLPVVAPVNGDNRRYLETKARRAGHWLEAADALEVV